MIQQRLWQDLELTSGADCTKPVSDIVLDDLGVLDGISPLKVLTAETSTLTVLAQQFSAVKLSSSVDFGDYSAAISKKGDADALFATADQKQVFQSMPAAIIKQAQENTRSTPKKPKQGTIFPSVPKASKWRKKVGHGKHKVKFFLTT